jgi:uncharacterized membrane protein YagU involved in acid resistance
MEFLNVVEILCYSDKIQFRSHVVFIGIIVYFLFHPIILPLTSFMFPFLKYLKQFKLVLIFMQRPLRCSLCLLFTGNYIAHINEILFHVSASSKAVSGLNLVMRQF